MLSLLSFVCPIRDAMQARANHLSDSVNTATALVGLGVALELIEPIHDLTTWAKFKKRELVHREQLAEFLPVSEIAVKPKYRGADHPKLVNWVGRIGLILVVVGVVGEWKYGAKLEDAHNTLHTLDIAELTAAQIEAGDAAKSAASAKASADEAGRVADEALGKSNAANEAAGNATTKADAVAKQAGELQTQLNAVEAKRAELEKSLINLAICNAPRVIPQDWIPKVGGMGLIADKSTSDPLKPFATEAVIEFIPDWEARRAALNIRASLHSAGWEIDKFDTATDINDGVEVQHFFAPSGKGIPYETWHPLLQKDQTSAGAADAVIDFLHSYNWQAKSGFPLDEQGKIVRGSALIPEGGIRIRVGLYPATTFVTPKGETDIAALVARNKQQIEAHEKEAEKHREMTDEKNLKTLNAEGQALYKAETERSRKQEELWKQRMSGPCQPLTTLPTQ
jgi:hypothetical protein